MAAMATGPRDAMWLWWARPGGIIAAAMRWTSALSGGASSRRRIPQIS
jgi:hypothetical protein